MRAGMLAAGTAAALVWMVSAPSWGAEGEPERSPSPARATAARPARTPAPPKAAAPASTAAPGSAAAAAAGGSPPGKPARVPAGVLVRAASRRAQEREAASPPAPAERRRGREAGNIISIEIDWHAGSPAR